MFSTAKIIIHILDVNDNRPQFSETSYVAIIPENAPAATSVRTITVSTKIFIIKLPFL